MNRLVLRLAARCVAQTLAGIGAGALLELATWKAALMGLASNVVPAIVHLLQGYADGRTLEEAANELGTEP